MAKWITEIRSTRGPKIFLPSECDRSGWRDISSAGDTWATFYDEKNGSIVYCADYYQQALVEAGLAGKQAAGVASAAHHAAVSGPTAGTAEASGPTASDAMLGH